MEFLDRLVVDAPDLREKYEEMESLYNKKLWHQLSLTLDSFVSDASNKRGYNFKELYVDFISKFETRLNPIRLAQLLAKIGFSLDSAEETLEFFSLFTVSKSKLGADATMCLEMDSDIAKLKLGLKDEVKLSLEQAAVKLQSSNVSETALFSKFYKASAEYRKVVGPPKEFYKAALLYLTYTHLDDLNLQERYEIATDIALAAVCGEGVYNLGEVVTSPVLACLSGTPNSWLQDIINALFRGDIAQFNAVVDANKQQYSSHVALVANHEEIKKKAVLLCVLNLAFHRTPHDRIISFHEISNKACIPLEQVEWVLMKALSIGIIKGTIDEVESTVSITWVQPRVLDQAQLDEVGSQITSWSNRVKSTLITVQDQTPELYV